GRSYNPGPYEPNRQKRASLARAAGETAAVECALSVVSPSAEVQREASPLRRLLPLINAHAFEFWGGMFLICLGRVFEAGVPKIVAVGINRIAAGSADLLI